MRYQVGQILYVIMNGKTAVAPVQVVEETHRRTLNGTEVSYVVAYGKDGRTVDIDQVDGEIFTTSNAVRQALVDRSTTALNKLVNNAMERAKDWYPGAFEGPGDSESDIDDIVRKDGERPRDGKGRFVPQQPPSPEHTGDGQVTVQLEDGSVVRVKMPEIMG